MVKVRRRAKNKRNVQNRRLPAPVLRALVRKYRTLLKLRRQRETYEMQGIFRLQTEAMRRRRQRLRMLATLHPGVLRELEAMSASAVEKRLAVVTGLLKEPGPAPLWLLAVLEYHALIKTHLRTKRRNSMKRDRKFVACLWEQLANSYRKSPDEIRAFVLGG